MLARFFQWFHNWRVDRLAASLNETDFEILRILKEHPEGITTEQITKLLNERMAS